mmetsp:Transcript_46897/g.142069  ORF Transcript_46897/g.142069 Transcript_46897/m.142069 type:complete len:121 (+) Transcript_46897:1843-2205(+)
MAVLCGFLAVVYGMYAILVFAFKDDIISPYDEAEALMGRSRIENQPGEGHMELSRIGRNVALSGAVADAGAVGSDGTRVVYKPPLSPGGVGVVSMSPGVLGKMKKDPDGFLTTHATTDSY